MNTEDAVICCNSCDKTNPDLVDDGKEILTTCCGSNYFVCCQECGDPQPDMGSYVGCDNCGATLPYIDYLGRVMFDDIEYYKAKSNGNT